MIEIRDLTVAFGGVTALNKVTVDLSDKVVGIIGPNGAGKTTFLNVLPGFVMPKSGAIHAFGADILAMSPSFLMRRATAAPMPVPPPVITAVLPANLMESSLMLRSSYASTRAPSLPSAHRDLTQSAKMPGPGAKNPSPTLPTRGREPAQSPL
jgi:energy-coupling factor transporter ATP-binding protein EcfA2